MGENHKKILTPNLTSRSDVGWVTSGQAATPVDKVSICCKIVIAWELQKCHKY